MKKILALLLMLVLACTLFACGKKDDTPKPDDTPSKPDEPVSDEDAKYMEDLIAAAKAEGELLVYGSCGDEYIQAACERFEEMYGIKVQWAKLAGGEVQAKAEEENGNPSADVWFGGTSEPQALCAAEGLLEPYHAKNEVHLMKDFYMDKDGYWHGIYTGIAGFIYDKDELERLGLDAPKDWDDLLDPKYKGIIWFSNPNTASTAKLVINAMIQMRGHDEAMKYFVELDKNIGQYTKSGGGAYKGVGAKEAVIAIGFLHDAVKLINEGYDNIGLAVPASGTASEIGAVSIFKGCKHPNAAKLWIEYCLSPDCVDLGDETDSFQFLLLDNIEQPPVLAQFDLDPSVCIDYDFEDAKANTTRYVEEFFEALGAAADSRFKTE